jgi:hypothetical protein
MLKINQKNIHHIKDFAIKAFHNRPSFANYSQAEIQAACICEGLARYMAQQGLIPNFGLEDWQQEDSETVGYDGEGSSNE